MRFIHPALFAFALSTSVSAKALRQYRPRSPVDVCSYLDTELVIKGDKLGKLEVCICTSSLPNYLATDPVLRKAVRKYGDPTVINKVTRLINDAYGAKDCYYPKHAEPHCEKDYPCDFDCKDGFKPKPEYHPRECVCEYPYTVCNGVCGEFKHCGSPGVHILRDKRDAMCPAGWSACGVWGASGKDFECVDVAHDLWSCGGCGTPITDDEPTGVDCTAITGVADVSCMDSRCVVNRCGRGYKVSSDNSTCIATTSSSSSYGSGSGHPIFINNNNDNGENAY